MLKNIFECIVLGIIQGITEPLPISSSGHLLMFKKLFNFSIANDINFEIIVNFGSFLAIMFLYKKEIFSIIKDFFSYIFFKDKDKKLNYNYANLIIISTIPAGIIGLLFKSKIEFLSNNIKLIAIALLITGFCLFLINDSKGRKEKKDITKKDALIIGLYQIVALFPGISRSGSTIVGGIFQDIKKEDAVNYSFMLYLPISLATFILSLKEIIINWDISLYVPYFIGLIVSMFITYFSAKFFLNIIKKEKLTYFSLYCLIVGIIILTINH